MPALGDISRFLDTTLRIAEIPDYPGAVNGVQLENTGDIQRVATAVDFSSDTIDGAIANRADLLLVHHGMFWGGVQPFTGYRRQRLWSLITHDVAVYSAHLPLDMHPDLGNNALLAHRLGLTPTAGFAKYHNVEIGLSGASDTPTRDIAARARALAEEFRGSFVATPFSEDRTTRRWGICSGAGADSSTIQEAVARGLDTLIVGEGPHHTAVTARELGIVILYAGHYATETLGVRALGDTLAREYGIQATFIDVPSGL